jgi:hypothetical protein
MDGGHRLPGEEDSESSPLLEDAEHWLQVYRELLAFKRTLLRTTVVVDAGDDPAPLHAELDRLELRRSFWERRARELQSR